MIFVGLLLVAQEEVLKSDWKIKLVSCSARQDHPVL